MSLLRRYATRGTKLRVHSANRSKRCYTVQPHAASSDSLAARNPFDVSRVLHTTPVPIRTLCHRWLKPEDYIDLSDARGVVTVKPSETSPSVNQEDKAGPQYITYWRENKLHDQRRQLTYFPFPVNTRGFFYFRHHSVFPIASALRFRIAQKPTADEYFKGQDLRTPCGTRWEIPLIALASSERYAGLMHVLRQDGYVPPQLADYCAKLARSLKRDTIGWGSQLIFKRYEPFYLDLGARSNKIYLVGMRGIHRIFASDLFDERGPYPFKSGIVSCRFELYRGLMALRILRVIEPVQFIEQYEGDFEKLQTGQFVTSRGRPHMFLAKRDKAGYNLKARWESRAEGNAFAWSWASLEDVAGKDWVFPWRNRSRKE